MTFQHSVIWLYHSLIGLVIIDLKSFLPFVFGLAKETAVNIHTRIVAGSKILFYVSLYIILVFIT